MADHFTGTPAPVHPHENQILAEPATPQRCAEDYAAAEARRRNQSNRDDANLRGGK
ncbi:hypothetical protein [Streptomyces sp. NPDC056227]|uniref:hypothetical protein n=1 Tax=Streptomyces sp. NPDC056227 TaxID=3345753 RepID=UPI0035DDD42D